MAEQILKTDNLILIKIKIPNEVEFLKDNPHVMSRDMFRRLVENIKRDGYLSSTPFVYPLENGKYEILSGNHRVKAGIEAGLTEIIALTTSRKLTDDEKKAIAISHNAIFGFDDPHLLKKMYDSIKDVNMKMYAGIDLDTIKKMIKNVKFDMSISGVSLKYIPMQFLFLEDDLRKLNEVIDEISNIIEKRETYVLKMKDYDLFLEALTEFSDKLKVKNKSVVISYIFEYALEKLKEEMVDYEEDI